MVTKKDTKLKLTTPKKSTRWVFNPKGNKSFKTVNLKIKCNESIVVHKSENKTEG